MSPTPSVYPMTAWERYMAIDHSHQHSMTVAFRFWFSGRLDRDQVERAIVRVAAIHPMVAVHLTSRGWSPQPFDPSKQIDWHEDDRPIDWSHLAGDDFLVRFSVRMGKLHALQIEDDEFGPRDGSLFVIKVQHAVCDAMAILSFVEQLCMAIEHPRSLPEIRSMPVEILPSFVDRIVRARWDWQRVFLYFWNRPAAYRIPTSDSESISSELGFVRRIASQVATERIEINARELGVTVNDLLIEGLFRSLAKRVVTGLIRIGIPTSMRSPGDRDFCNRVSMIFVDRTDSQIGSAALLQSISREMNLVKERQLGWAMLLSLRWGCLFRGALMKRFLRLNRVESTAILSNIGRPFATHTQFGLGAARLVSCDLLSPTRPGTNVVLSANRFQGRLALSLRYNAPHVSAEQAGVILDDVLKAWS